MVKASQRRALLEARGASKTAGVLRPAQFPRLIAATDKAIDSLVYESYGLTDVEIAIVEGRGR